MRHAIASPRLRVILAVVVLCTLVFTVRVGERYRPESTAIVMVRAIVSGESTYASVNDGYYDTLECLANPSCVPGARAQQPFVQPELVAMKEVRGYRFEFHAGPAAEARSDQRRSRSAMTRFAIVAIPLTASTEQRAFCADDRGTIYVTGGGAVPRVDRGRCLDADNPLR